MSEVEERVESMANHILSAEGGERTAWLDIQRELHTLKGAAGFVGLDQFSELCHELETFLQGVGKGAVEASVFDVLYDACELVKSMAHNTLQCSVQGTALARDARVPALCRRLKQVSGLASTA